MAATCFGLFPFRGWASSAHDSTIPLHHPRHVWFGPKPQLHCPWIQLHPRVASTFQMVCIKRRERERTTPHLFPLSWVQAVAFGAHYTAWCADVAIGHAGYLSIKNHEPYTLLYGLWHEAVFHLYVMLSFISAFRWKNRLRIDNKKCFFLLLFFPSTSYQARLHHPTTHPCRVAGDQKQQLEFPLECIKSSNWGSS